MNAFTAVHDVSQVRTPILTQFLFSPHSQFVLSFLSSSKIETDVAFVAVHVSQSYG